MTGTLSTPRCTSPASAGNVSILARSPVAPKITSASTSLVAMSAPLPDRPTHQIVAQRCCHHSGRVRAIFGGPDILVVASAAAQRMALAEPRGQEADGLSDQTRKRGVAACPG